MTHLHAGRLRYLVWIIVIGLTGPAVAAAQSGATESGNPESDAKQASNEAAWRAGTARVDITPGEPMWMAGYGFRSEPGDGMLHPIWAKALALEDAEGDRAVLVTSDLLGFPADVSARLADRIETQYGIAREQLLLTSSHTHSGPVLSRALQDIYPLDEPGWAIIDRYTAELEDRIVGVVGEALDQMEPARLASGNGVTRFAVNRRNNSESELPALTELDGPSDHAVPVLSVMSANDDLLAIVFGYACHATVLRGQEWAGDYPGYAQIALERAYPGATALFFSGAGADQNPLPRRTVPLAEQYGTALAAAVTRAIKEATTPLTADLEASYSEISIGLSSPPDRAALQRAADDASGSHQRWAHRMLQQAEQGAEFANDYPYPIQTWRLGDQTLVALGGEVVVDYAVELKRILGQDVFVAAYANDVMGYIPSTRVLREGGYEGATSQRVYGQPSTWTADLEANILSEVLRQAHVLGAPLPESALE